VASSRIVPVAVANALNTNPLQGREFIVVLWAVWSLGTVLMFGRLFSGCAIIAWLFKIKEVKALTAFDVLQFDHGIPVEFSGNRQAPAVVGFLRPRILLPYGIDQFWISMR
jgi:beta-lactamase regulating signal transducer with metallopeptidase domain